MHDWDDLRIWLEVARARRFASAAKRLGLDPATISRRAKALERKTGAPLYRREKDGRVHRCSFDPVAIGDASDWIEKHRRFWTQQLDSLAAYLEDSGPTRGSAGRGGGGGRLPNEQGDDS